MSAPISTPTPITKPERIVGLDVLRGLAIFGILVVNVEQMFLPFFFANDPVAVRPGAPGTWLAWGVTDALFENKFITLFSLLFGAGFCLQWQRLRERQRGFNGLYLRRLGVLLIFGLAHGIFLYQADVLALYALTALLFLPWKRASARLLLIVGGLMLALMVGWNAVLSAPGADDADLVARQRAVVAEIATIRRTAAIGLPAGTYPPLNHFSLEEDVQIEQGEDGKLHIEAATYPLPMPASLAILILDGNEKEKQARVEYAVFSHGPIKAAAFARLSFLAFLLLLYGPVYLIWRTLALFLLGAGLVKAGLLRGTRRPLWRRTAIVCLGVGLPVSLVATVLRGFAHHHPGTLTWVGNVLHDLSSLVLAAGLGAAVLLWCAEGLRSRLQRGLAAVGRLALSHYIGQSAVMSLLATSYGFGLYGDLPRLALLALSIGCFGLQILASSIWLRHFRMGPLEWVWRCLTYGRWLPIRHAG